MFYKLYCTVRTKLRVIVFNNIIKKYIDPNKSSVILEVGCNTGEFVKYLMTQYPKSTIIGADINDKFKNEFIHAVCATDLSDRFDKSVFDLVCAFETVEHIKEMEKFFFEVQKILKDRGIFVISFPFEMFRGQTALFDSLFIYRNLAFAKQLHVHKLFPAKIRQIMKNLQFSIITSTLRFIPWPSFVMVFQIKK